MQFLVQAPSAVGDALARHEHKVHPYTEGDALQIAREKQWDIITTDAAVALSPFDGGKPFGRCIVHLQLTGGDVEMDDAVDRLFARYPRLSPGRLYTVTASRVKIRQLPTRRIRGENGKS
jgi:hypothetical protein